jgi:hypothetical protein
MSDFAAQHTRDDIAVAGRRRRAHEAVCMVS